MFSKSQVTHKTLWHDSGMNDNQLNNKVVIRTYTQQRLIKSIETIKLYKRSFSHCYSLCLYISMFITMQVEKRYQMS